MSKSPEPHSPEWLLAHGYMLHCGVWIDRIWLSMVLAQHDAVAAARAWRKRNGLPQRPPVRSFG
jgi:hypothetical protein